MYNRDDLKIDDSNDILIKKFHSKKSEGYNWETLIRLGIGANGVRKEVAELILNSISNN